MQQSLVACAGRAGLVGIDARDDENFVLDLLLHLAQTADIIQHRVGVICRAGADNEQEPVILAGEDIADDLGAFFYDLLHFRRDRIHFFRFLRNRQLSFKFHVHHSGISP